MTLIHSLNRSVKFILFSSHFDYTDILHRNGNKMSRIIFCHYLQKDAEGLDFQLYPGEVGKRIFDQISKEAWQLWMKKQTMFINENKLNMMNAEHRKRIEAEMQAFLFEGKDVVIEGFTPDSLA